MEFLVNARLRATCILLVVYVHHVTSKSRDICIYARVVLPTDISVFPEYGQQDHVPLAVGMRQQAWKTAAWKLNASA